MSGRGGARHFSKPLIDQGLLYKVLCDHEDLVMDMKGYEQLSRNSAVNPKAMHQMLPLINALVDIEGSAEIHPQGVRSALLHLITEKPELNTSKYNGAVFVNLRAERLGVLLHHVRKLARNKPTPSVVSALTAQEFQELTETLKKVQLRQTLPLKKGGSQAAQAGECSKGSLKKDWQPLKKGKALKATASSKGTLKKVKQGSPLKKGVVWGDGQPMVAVSPNSRKLKSTASDVSVDSAGFPKMLASPKASPPRLWKQKRPGSKHQAEPTRHEDLKAALGVLKKPAAALKKAVAKEGSLKKVPAKKVSLKKETRKPWVKLSKTTAKKPPRCYLTGSHSNEQKKFLIVEVAKTRSLQYSWVVDRIKESLEKDHLTKEEALQMREDLCAEFP